jgi:uroporphyrinogen decarboxylase
MGFDLEFAAGEGPVIHNPVRSAGRCGPLRPVEPRDSLAHVMEAVRLVRRELDGKTPLIGFAGAPFTLASYVIEGGPSKNYLKTKRLMVEQPETWDRLMAALAELVSDYLLPRSRPARRPCSCSTAGPARLRPARLPRARAALLARIFERIRPTGVPAIHFSVGPAPTCRCCGKPAAM